VRRGADLPCLELSSLGARTFGFWRRVAGAALTLGACVACSTHSGAPREAPVVVTISASGVGTEARLLHDQIARFTRSHPGVRVAEQLTPDDADQRHQLYVEWLNARESRPDVLALDVVWTPEFAAAGWLRPLGDFHPDARAFFPETIKAGRYRGRLYALPWFVDVGMLYWRTDLIPRAPRTFAELEREAQRVRARDHLPYGFVWQGARYEGLVTNFLEVLGGFGGQMTDSAGRVAVDSRAGVSALAFLAGTVGGISPRAVLTWHEEQTRFAFQNGDALFMRNWPYAYRLLGDPSRSRVAGRFAIAPMPSAPGGAPTAALGGAALAVNAHSRHPRAAYELVKFLTARAQMLERARVAGELPARPALYNDPALARALPMPPAAALAVVEHARARPPTPLYSRLSETLQLHLHRALSGQATPRTALGAAQRTMRAEQTRFATGRAPPHSSLALWVVRVLVFALLLLAVRAVLKRRPRRARAPPRGEARLAWLLSAPALAVIALIALFPLGWALWESLHAHDLGTPWRGTPFVGLANYAEALSSARFWNALGRTALFTATSVSLELVLGLALALALDRPFRGRGALRAASLLPWALPTVVAALVWRFLFDGRAAVANEIAARFGAHRVAWLAGPMSAWVPLVLADVWKTTPFVALLLLAGLQNVDGALIEAARVDGAGPLRRLWYVTLPLLRPAIVVALIFRTLDAFRVFDLVYVLTGGGPGTATEPIALTTFDTLLTDLRVGYGSALGVIVFAVTFALALLYVRALGAPAEGEP
jgi:ABC-type sugar transport system permease subunit/ABC-type glycerol-3-phosphate transport system substrate-binding protein